jgi:hypothetical protein
MLLTELLAAGKGAVVWAETNKLDPSSTKAAALRIIMGLLGSEPIPDSTRVNAEEHCRISLGTSQHRIT